MTRMNTVLARQHEIAQGRRFPVMMDELEDSIDLEESLKACKVSRHPVLMHKLTQLRRKETSNKHFRELLREITLYLGYEATADLETQDMVVQTPLATHTGQVLATTVALIPILRSGIGMVNAMLDILPYAQVHHIGMYRNKESLLPVLYFNKLPAKPNVELAIILEPIIATSGTINAVVDIIKKWGVSKIKVITVIASKQGLGTLLTEHPDIDVSVAAIDDTLSPEGYIIPGLGDVGDRQFDTYVSPEKDLGGDPEEHSNPKKRKA